MSLALTAHILPSRRLRLMLIAYGSACCSAAFIMAAQGDFGGLPLTPFACLAAGSWAGFLAWRGGTTYVIDVSGLGELRLTVQHGMAAPVREPGLMVRLLPGSTVWSRAMLLWLSEEGSSARPVLVGPDSMAPDDLRRLAVAIRSIAGRDSHLLGQNKIV